ncbi:MAG TPA: hypothetical protein VEH31_24970 [Streptosporangiaceae bacterium]|nr:hypothetical protein [Streptosporangiaceae bacterium]HYA50908.1 hypothetical protein [Streptosporangiaceae bacterium]
MSSPQYDAAHRARRKQAIARLVPGTPPDGVQIVLVEVPADHPLRRDRDRRHRQDDELDAATG